MPAKTTIYLQENVRRLLDERKAPGQGDSGIVADIIERYHELLRVELPELPYEDWKLLCSQLKDKAPPEPTLLQAWMLNSVPRAGESKLWAKVSQMKLVEVVAVVDWVERFWASAARGEAMPFPTVSA